MFDFTSIAFIVMFEYSLLILSLLTQIISSYELFLVSQMDHVTLTLHEYNWCDLAKSCGHG